MAGIFLPVYSDEIGWRFQERAGIDGLDKMFSDLCGPNTLAVPPLFMMPVRHFSATLNLWFADPLYVRLSGIIYALVWLAMLLALVGRIAADAAQRRVLTIIAVGLMALANMPLLLVWSRPEQPLLLAATGAMLIALADRDSTAATRTPTAWLRSAAILLLAAIAMSYHLKGLFLLPLLLACLIYSSRGPGSAWPRAGAAALIAVLAAQALSYWLGRLDCPGDPLLRAFYATHNFGADLSAIDTPARLFALIGELFGNISLWGYIQLAAPSPAPMANWLPAGQIGAEAAGRWNIALALAWFAVAALMAIGLARGALACWRKKRLDARIVLAVVLLGSIIAWSATQGVRNVYEASLILPLLMLGAILAISAGRLEGRAASLRDALALYLGLGAILSMGLTAALWAPSLARSNAQTGYIREQAYSLPVFGYGAIKPDILGLARTCGIPEPAQARSLLIDEATYFAFMPSRLPQHRLGVLGLWKGSIDDPVAYLKSRKSHGMILGCHLLPDELRARAKSRGSLCCIGAKDF